MTVVRLDCDPAGRLIRCEASGHAGFAAHGTDIVCAAVSVLLRTALEVLEHTDGVQVQADTARRGAIRFQAKQTGTVPVEERLICVADFLRTGLAALSAEYPENVCLQEQSF